MAQIIILAKHYQKRPSEILAIDDEYTAFCFDEWSLYLTAEATDKEGKLNWNKIRWRDNKGKGNKDFMEFVKKQKS